MTRMIFKHVRVDQTMRTALNFHNAPKVYARVSRVYEWIESEVCARSRHANETEFNCSSDDVGDSKDSSNRSSDSSSGDNVHASSLSSSGDSVAHDDVGDSNGSSGSTSGSSSGDNAHGPSLMATQAKLLGHK